ncbi:hypothetical protein GCM10007301_26240 [Azorhizobium oxalatiphilum]|uniref:Uncharacterized protein n=1 Tax=Azorhizobium oxalatiphilum TaxID=980631 RepID=A0A917C017_9HYPH|nr:hypothetical protein [Azorhizobium oxalatiphilum]GGF65234.1 hypothetical protein GCM10007301_26240 [Azorhizobium oxalatiphilum]
MTDMAELQKRKMPINLAIVHVEPDAFLASFMGWLEITAYITAQRTGNAVVPIDGVTPALSAADLASSGVQAVANDALFAFCMTAALKADVAAVDAVEAGLIARFGTEYPGVLAITYFRAANDNPILLEDFVGQAGRKWLEGDKPPPPLRAKEDWSAGLRFFEKARKSNFNNEVLYPLARWTRERWGVIVEKEPAFLHHIEDNLPILREALGDPRNDQAFIANLLLKAAPAVDMELTEEYEGFLRSIARR